MKNLYKKIGVVVLSSMLLAGGALVAGSSVSHADSISIKDIKNIFDGSDYYKYYNLEFLGFDYRPNPYGPDIIDFEDDIGELEREVDDYMLGFGIYKVGGMFFSLSDI